MAIAVVLFFQIIVSASHSYWTYRKHVPGVNAWCKCAHVMSIQKTLPQRQHELSKMFSQALKFVFCAPDISKNCTSVRTCF